MQAYFLAYSMPCLRSLLTGAMLDLLISKYKTTARHADTKVVVQEHLAKFFSVQHSVATAWLHVVPTNDAWEIDDTTVKSALWFMLGVSPGPPDQTYFMCECGYKGSDCHHAMTCYKMS